MSIKSLLEISIDSIKNYKTLIDGHKSNKEYGNDIVSAYNILGDNIEALSEEIDDIFSSDESYTTHFESDDIQDYISFQLNNAFDDYEELKKQKKCEEKVSLAYEWLFEVMLFTTDDEELKSKITLNKNDIKIIDSKVNLSDKIKEKSRVKIEIEYDGQIEDIVLVVEEIVDDYLYCYLGDKENEEDLIIFNSNKVLEVK